MNDVVFQLAVVFVPGMIWSTIVDRLCSTGGKRSSFSIIMRTFGFGMASYVIYFVVYSAWCRATDGVWPSLLNGLSTAPGVGELKSLRLIDIVLASMLSSTLAIAWSAAANRKLFTRWMQRLGITRKFGDEGVWEFAFNMGTAAVEFVNIRDFETRVMYSGYVRAFSEGGDVREILLDQARVFDLDTGARLFEMPVIYLARKADSLHIEFPYQLAASGGATGEGGGAP